MEDQSESGSHTLAPSEWNPSRTVVIYHAPCSDGFCAAWVAWKLFGDHATYVGAKHDKKYIPPDVKDKHVLIADFSYPRDTLLQMKEEAKTLVLLDHHKTAIESLGDLDFCTLDNTRSGAMLTWNYLFPHIAPLWLVCYVQDRDLWKNELPRCDRVMAAVQSWGFDFKTWEENSQRGMSAAWDEGTPILAHLRRDTEQKVLSAQLVDFEGATIPTINIPFLSNTSDVLNQLAQESDAGWSIGWWRNKDGQFLYSLRSDGSVDVSEIAKKYGGGGHHNAAGFASDRLII